MSSSSLFKMINRSSTCALAAFLFSSGCPGADVNGLKLKMYGDPESEWHGAAEKALDLSRKGISGSILAAQPSRTASTVSSLIHSTAEGVDPVAATPLPRTSSLASDLSDEYEFTGSEYMDGMVSHQYVKDLLRRTQGELQRILHSCMMEIDRKLEAHSREGKELQLVSWKPAYYSDVLRQSGLVEANAYGRYDGSTAGLPDVKTFDCLNKFDEMQESLFRDAYVEVEYLRADPHVYFGDAPFTNVAGLQLGDSTDEMLVQGDQVHGEDPAVHEMGDASAFEDIMIAHDHAPTTPKFYLYSPGARVRVKEQIGGNPTFREISGSSGRICNADEAATSTQYGALYSGSHVFMRPAEGDRKHDDYIFCVKINGKATPYHIPHTKLESLLYIPGNEVWVTETVGNIQKGSRGTISICSGDISGSAHQVGSDGKWGDLFCVSMHSDPSGTSGPVHYIPEANLETFFMTNDLVEIESEGGNEKLREIANSPGNKRICTSDEAGNTSFSRQYGGQYYFMRSDDATATSPVRDIIYCIVAESTGQKFHVSHTRVSKANV